MYEISQLINCLIMVGIVGLFVLIFSAIASYWLNRNKKEDERTTG